MIRDWARNRTKRQASPFRRATGRATQERTGQILLDLIPHIYDTERRIRIIGADGSESLVDINKPQIESGQEKVQNDVTVGAYDVTLDTGPSYATRRQEAQDGMKAFLQAFPEAAPVIGDLYAKGQDWQYASEISERLQAVLPPQIKQMIEKDKLASDPNAEPSPEQAAEQQAQQKAMQAQQMMEAAGMAEMQAKVEKSQAEAATAKENARKAKADADKAEFDAQAAQENIGKVKAQTANEHMENLRTIQAHDADMERGEEGHRISTAGELSRMAREEDSHERSSSQSDEKHQATIKKMTAPKPEPADA
jgi:hypothetical protein